jgi:hypothetical protein
MPSMSLHPFPPNLMLGRSYVKFLPQVAIQDFPVPRIAPFLFSPAVHLPSRQPLCNSIAHVLRIGDDGDITRLAKRLQPLDNRAQFHAVISGVLFGPKNFLLVRSVAQNARPTSRSRIANASSVCNDRDALQIHNSPARPRGRLPSDCTQRSATPEIACPSPRRASPCMGCISNLLCRLVIRPYLRFARMHSDMQLLRSA